MLRSRFPWRRSLNEGVCARCEKAPAQTQGPALRALLPGLLLVAALGALATSLGQLAPVIGAPVIAILLGVALRLTLDPGHWAAHGIAVGARVPLQGAIVLLGAGLSLGAVVRVGAGTFPVMLGTLAVALILGRVIGRALGIAAPLRTLVAVGTGICGASAIAAVASVVEVKAAELTQAISTIFVFNIAAVLLFPLMGHAIGLGQQSFGLWAGTAVNDTSSVVAAGYAYGDAAGDHAVVVKLTRATLIVPIVLALSLHRRRGDERPGGGRSRWARLVPPFLLLFLLASAVNSAGLITTPAAHSLNQLALFLVAVALAAIGLSTQPRELAATGPRPLLLGLILWLAVASSSLLLQALTGQLRTS